MTVGDMTVTRVPGAFRLVYLVWNAITNLTTQEEQAAVFTNAAAHLVPGGCFVVEVLVPRPYPVAGRELGRVFMMEPDHVGIDTFDDVVGQIASSHHWMVVGGGVIRESTRYRYVYPSELDLMGRCAGLALKHRWTGWDRTPFTADSTNQVVVFEKTS